MYVIYAYLRIQIINEIKTLIICSTKFKVFDWSIMSA